MGTGFVKLKLNFLAVSLLVLGFSLFFVPNFKPFTHEGMNYFHITLNGVEVGTTSSIDEAQKCLRKARRNIAATSDELIYMKADMEAEGQDVFFGKIDRESVLIANMQKVLEDSRQTTLEKCYTVKFGKYIIVMKSLEDINRLLTHVLEQYDPENEYIVSLIPNTSKEIDVITSSVLSTKEKQKQDEISQRLPSAGIEAQLAQYFDAVVPEIGMDFNDFDLGLQTIEFGDTIEIVESYMPANRIVSYEDALADVTGEVATDTTYTVQSGDTISAIAAKYGLSVNSLISINASLESENSLIRPGDVITVTVPQKKLTVKHINQEYYEEDYTAATVYKNNDSWYTNKSEVIQEAVTGHRRVIAKITYSDDEKISSEIVKQETTKEAVPQIIERGTQIPPTYIWPVSSGYISSGFGARKAPKAGASTYHQGVDIALPTGNSVMASSGGTVAVAGWQSGYGYLVVINHPNGVQTRYGHLSKLLVSAGQTVKQGQVIARSGNTGNSTGPHLHFEYRVNGTAKDPRNYITR